MESAGPTAESTVCWYITDEHVRFAREALRERLVPTPLVPLSSLHPCLWAKLETLQPTGSFKIRGALTRMLHAHRMGAHTVVTASAGNHGQGIAMAARWLGMRAIVYVPVHTPTVKQEAIAKLGAEVRRASGGYDLTEAAARDEAHRLGLPFLSPFDDPWVAAGNGATLALEVIETLPDVATFLFPVGGGGLLAGIAAATASLRNEEQPQLIAVQSEACPAMARSLAEGHPIERMHAREPTLAEGLEGGVCRSTFEAAREANVSVQTVAEHRIADAMAWAYRTLGWALEGSAAVALAWTLDHLDALPTERSSVLVLTGCNVDPAVLARCIEANRRPSPSRHPMPSTSSMR